MSGGCSLVKRGLDCRTFGCEDITAPKWCSLGSTLFHQHNELEEESVGKGDKRTRRGKLWRGTYGKCRPRKKKNKNLLAQSAPAAGAPGETAVPSGSPAASQVVVER